MTGNKGRLLFLVKYLDENTDEEHALTREEILAAYEKNGYTASKNTFTDDLKVLEEQGFRIRKKPKTRPEAYFVERTFERAELRALIDAVSFAQFFTAEKSNALIRKISSLASKPGQRGLTANVHVQGWQKTGSPNVNVAITTILKAIRDGKQISFLYTDYNEKKEIVFRNGGQRYRVSPYALILDNNRYYAVAYNPAREKIINFRIDRMRSVMEEQDRVQTRPGFDFQEYTKTNIGMYSGDSPERAVTLQCEKYHMASLVDFFGEDVETVFDPARQKITAHVKVRTGRTFYSWVTGFAGGMRILAPEDVRAEYEDLLRNLLRAQGVD